MIVHDKTLFLLRYTLGGKSCKHCWISSQLSFGHATHAFLAQKGGGQEIFRQLAFEPRKKKRKNFASSIFQSKGNGGVCLWQAKDWLKLKKEKKVSNTKICDGGKRAPQRKKKRSRQFATKILFHKGIAVQWQLMNKNVTCRTFSFCGKRRAFAAFGTSDYIRTEEGKECQVGKRSVWKRRRRRRTQHNFARSTRTEEGEKLNTPPHTRAALHNTHFFPDKNK